MNDKGIILSHGEGSHTVPDEPDAYPVKLIAVIYQDSEGLLRTAEATTFTKEIVVVIEEALFAYVRTTATQDPGRPVKEDAI